MSTTEAIRPEQRAEPDDGAEPELQRSLKQRHMTMISLGGVIGAGLIVSMALVDDARPQLLPSFISLAVVIVAAWWHGRRAAGRERSTAGDRRVPAT